MLADGWQVALAGRRAEPHEWALARALRGEAEWTPFANFHNVFGANYSRFDRLFAGPIVDPLAPPTPTTYLGERTRFDYRGDVALSPGNLVVFGAQREDERFVDPRACLAPRAVRPDRVGVGGADRVRRRMETCLDCANSMSVLGYLR